MITYGGDPKAPPISATMHLAPGLASQCPPSFWHNAASPAYDISGHCPSFARYCRRCSASSCVLPIVCSADSFADSRILLIMCSADAM